MAKTASGAVELTPRQSRFVDEYLIEPNGKQAAIAAGYAAGSADAAASRLLRNDKVRQVLDERRALRAKRTQVDADYVLHRLHAIDQLDIIDILDDAGNVRPVKEWPKAWRQSITAADLHEMQTGDVMTVVRKIKWPDKLKTLELIGKHVSVKAFEAEKDSGAEDMAAALSQIAEKLPG
ncbi:MAG: terminase small subunit [Halomonas sp.]|nr:terminase small subunit [Halomonas sp.]